MSTSKEDEFFELEVVDFPKDLEKQSSCKKNYLVQSRQEGSEADGKSAITQLL